MHHDVQLSPDGKTLAVHVPMQWRKRGGRKVIVAPNGDRQIPATWAAPRSTIDTGLVKTLAQAFRWQRLLDSGIFSTIGDLAQAEKLDHSLVSRTLRLTLLAPDIVEAILDGRQSPALQRQLLLHGFPMDWNVQRKMVNTRRRYPNNYTAPVEQYRRPLLGKELVSALTVVCIDAM